MKLQVGPSKRYITLTHLGLSKITAPNITTLQKLPMSKLPDEIFRNVLARLKTI